MKKALKYKKIAQFERLKSRFEDNENTDIIVKCKEKICEILFAINKIR